MLAMGCAEVGNAIWLMTATSMGFPVSTTQTIVGSLIGVGFATRAGVTWGWEDGSVSQIAASWVISPLIAACFSAIVFATVKYSVLERKDSFKWAMRLIPFYLAGTCGILALFIAIEAPSAPDLSTIAGAISGSIIAVFLGVLIIAYVFFMPFFKRKLVKQDSRLRIWHIPLGPLLNKEDPPLYFPGKGEAFVTNYYEDAYGNVAAGKKDEEDGITFDKDRVGRTTDAPSTTSTDESARAAEKRNVPSNEDQVLEAAANTPAMKQHKKSYVEPHERFIGPVKHLSWTNPLKYRGYAKFALLRGVTTDVISHDSAMLHEIHARARRYDVRVGKRSPAPLAQAKCRY